MQEPPAKAGAIDVFDTFLTWLETIDPGWVYVIVGLSAYLENVFPPVPGDTVLVFGAYLVGRGIVEMQWVFLATTAGSVLGFMTCFAVGRWLDRRFIHRYMGPMFSESHYERVERWFQRYGYWVVGCNRFLSGARSIIAVASGIMGMRTRWVLVLATVSAAVWNGLLLSLGVAVGKNWELLVDYLHVYQYLVMMTIILILSTVLILLYLRKNSE